VAKIKQNVIQRRNWRNYSSEKIAEELKKVKLQTEQEIENIQEL